MELFNVNVLAVLVAALLPMVVGSLWYGPLFGKKWMSLMELSEEEIRASFNPMKSYGGSSLGAILMAFVMGFLIHVTGMDGWHVGALCWLGFVVPYGYQAVAFEDKKMAVYVLNIAYNLVALVLMGVVLGAWQ